MFRIYFWIDGDDFDADGFQAGLPKDLRGTVEVRRRINNGAIEVFGRYWKSIVKIAQMNGPEELLAELITLYDEEIQRAKACSAGRIVAEIVAEFLSDDDLRGFYFPAETMLLLARLGVCLDIDIVRELNCAVGGMGN